MGIFKSKCDFMKKEVFLLCVCLLISSCAVPTVVVRGTVYDENDEPLPSCTVYTSRRNKVVNDSSGNYSIAVPNKGRTFIHFFSIGYKDTVLLFLPNRGNDRLDVKLQPDILCEEKVVVGPLKAFFSKSAGEKSSVKVFPH